MYAYVGESDDDDQTSHTAPWKSLVFGVVEASSTTHTVAIRTATPCLHGFRARGVLGGRVGALGCYAAGLGGMRGWGVSLGSGLGCMGGWF